MSPSEADDVVASMVPGGPRLDGAYFDGTRTCRPERRRNPADMSIQPATPRTLETTSSNPLPRATPPQKHTARQVQSARGTCPSQ